MKRGDRNSFSLIQPSVASAEGGFNERGRERERENKQINDGQLKGQTEPNSQFLVADVCRVLLIPAFPRNYSTWDALTFEEDTQEIADLRRKTQEIADFRRNQFVPFSLSLLFLPKQAGHTCNAIVSATHVTLFT